jgi:hypothetical protein
MQSHQHHHAVSMLSKDSPLMEFNNKQEASSGALRMNPKEEGSGHRVVKS